MLLVRPSVPAARSVAAARWSSSRGVQVFSDGHHPSAVVLGLVFPPFRWQRAKTSHAVGRVGSNRRDRRVPTKRRCKIEKTFTNPGLTGGGGGA